MAILVLFKHFSDKLCLNFLTLILSRPTVLHQTVAQNRLVKYGGTEPFGEVRYLTTVANGSSLSRFLINFCPLPQSIIE